MLTGKLLRYSEWLDRAKIDLAKAGLENPRLDAEYILSFITHIPRLHLSLNANQVLTTNQFKNIEKLLKRRVNREPLQYIVNSVEFYGFILHVNKQVLIPRPETEFLVDLIIKDNKAPSSILDIGTGSGAIALSLKQAFPNAYVLGADISMSALHMAIANARRLEINVKFRKSDVFSKIYEQFDIIVSNPPYLTEVEYLSTAPEIQNYEPRTALQAAEEGLMIYRKILEDAQIHLNPGGKIYLEIGQAQAAKISFLAQKSGFTAMEKRQDLNGFDRYFIIRM
jgi:release factor glutamine methyltransferase